MSLCFKYCLTTSVELFVVVSCSVLLQMFAMAWAIVWKFTCVKHFDNPLVLWKIFFFHTFPKRSVSHQMLHECKNSSLCALLCAPAVWSNVDQCHSGIQMICSFLFLLVVFNHHHHLSCWYKLAPEVWVWEY